jgi:hypothetical protein
MKLTLPLFGFAFAETTIAHDTELSVAIPDIVANKMLKAIFAKSAMITSVRRDFENEVAEYGSSVTIPKNGTLTTTDKQPNTALTYQAPTAGSVQIVLNKHKCVPFRIEDRALNLARPNALDSYIDDAVTAIVNDVEADLSAEWANAGTVVGAGVGGPFIGEVLECRTAIRVTNKAPKDIPLYLIIKDMAEMVEVDRFTSSDYVTSRPVETGEIGEIGGFVVKEGGEIVTTVSPTGTHRMAFARDAIALVTRPLSIPRAVGVNSTIVNKDGLGIRVTLGYSMELMSTVCNVDLLYGVKTVLPEWSVDLWEGN